MKKLSLAVLVLGTFLFAGCYADKEMKEGTMMNPKMVKCGTGDKAMMKCGSGKCGSSNKAMMKSKMMKCGSGKCGSAKCGGK